MKRLTLIIAAGLLSLTAGVTYAQEAEDDAASMGELLSVSIIATLLCTLIALPELMRWLGSRT